MLTIFGYAIPFKPELKFREYDCYKMFYCGVCKSIGRNFSQLSRFGLVYETAVLAIILSMATGNINNIEIKNGNCVAHPLKKSKYVSKDECIDYAAAVNVLLLYFKLRDSWNDDSNPFSLLYSYAIKSGFKKASEKNIIAADSTYYSINELTKLEKENCNDIDTVCEPFSTMLMRIFKWQDSDAFTTNPLKLDLLGKIGYNVGKWIYIVDAISDIESDKKKGSYNVFKYNYPQEDVKMILQLCLANCALSYSELIKIIESETDVNNINYINAKGVTDNLFYYGMRQITETKVGKLHESI